MNNCIVAIVGDMHVNSTTALCPPRCDLDDGGIHVASKYQRWIWNHWLHFWGKVREEKEKRNAPVLVVLNGDIGDDLKYSKTQLITTNPADILKLSVEALNPALDVADQIIVVRGTEAHVGDSAALEELIAHDINALPDGADNNSHWLFRATLCGTTFHIAHHPGHGHMRSWTRGGDANRLAATMVFRYTEQNLKPPDLAIFGHNHKPVDSYDNFATRAIILPSWQLTNAFGHRIGGDWLPIGGAYVICEDGQEPIVKKEYKTWPIKSWRSLKMNLATMN